VIHIPHAKVLEPVASVYTIVHWGGTRHSTLLLAPNPLQKAIPGLRAICASWDACGGKGEATRPPILVG
jgi:hypothetical protein